jgi:hypothetical protein
VFPLAGAESAVAVDPTTVFYRATITRVDAGHLSMISHPDAVTEVIRDAASQAL